MLFLVIILLSLSSVNALKCYTCNSLQRRDCGDPFDPPDREPLSLEYIKDCKAELERKLNEKSLPDYLLSSDETNNTYLCRKIVQNVESSTFIIRKCGWFSGDEDQEDKCVTKPGSAGPSTYCICKEKDLCNHSNDLIFNIFAFLISLISSYWIFQLNNRSI